LIGLAYKLGGLRELIGPVGVGMDVEAYREPAYSDAELFLNLLGTREGFLAAVVPYNNICASFCKTTCHSQIVC
jgi:hypothetical protein